MRSTGRIAGSKLGRALLVAVALTLASLVAAMPSRASQAGLPLMRSFVPAEYGAGEQNWAVVQGPDGMLYVGNQRGVISFDGQRWSLTPVANRSVVRSLAVDATGRVYVGANGEVGYLAPNDQGELRYVSLLMQLPEDARSFTDVWNTIAIDEGAVFSSPQRLMRWRDGKFEHWSPKEQFSVAFGGQQGVFVVDGGVGLLQLRAGGLHPLPGGERFRDLSRVGIVPLATGTTEEPELLVFSQELGFARYKNGQTTPWPTDVAKALATEGVQARSLRLLPDGLLTVGTLRGGLYALDAKGNMVARVEKNDGIPDVGVVASGQDVEGGLWLALGNGLARLSIPAQLSRFDERLGADHTVIALHRHEGTLKIGTTQGAFQLRPTPTPRLQALKAVKNQTLALLSTEGGLLTASMAGVHFIDGPRSTRVLDAYGASALLTLRTRSRWLLVGLGEGLALLHSDGSQWRERGLLPGLNDDVRTLVEDTDGHVWIGTYNTGLVRLDLSNLGADGTVGALPFERFGVEHGLPSINYNLVFPIDGEPAFATSAGIYRFDAAAGRFGPDPRYAGLFERPRTVYVLHDDPANGLWAYTEDPSTGLKETGLVRTLGDGTRQWDPRPLRAFTGQETFAIHADGDGVAWFGVGEGLFRFDGRIHKDYAQPFNTLLRRVSGTNNTLLYGGHGPAPAVALPYAANSLRFEYAAPSFDGENAIRFQVKLEGSDAEWSDWSAEDYKDYNNLFEGEYVFRVRAKNLYDTVGSEASYAFRVLPPWYRTFWALLGYAFLLGVIGWGLLRWRLRRLLAQKAALESTVAERTQQIATLGEIGRTVTAQLNLDSALTTLYAQLGRLLPADAVAIDLFRPEQAQIERRLSVRDGQPCPTQLLPLASSDPLTVLCIDQRRPLLIDDLDAHAAQTASAGDPGLDPLGNPGEPSRGARLYIPLLLQDRVLGVLAVANRRVGVYGSNERDLLLTLAAYAATAIDNARSHEQLGQQAQALRHANEQLVELDGFKQGMMAMIVHDLKNPLSSILNALDSPSLLSRLAQLRQASRQMLTMVLNILDVQKFEDTRVVLDTKHLSLAKVVAQAVEQVRYLVERKNLTLQVGIGNTLSVLGDGEMLERVVVNLLTNAVKYTPANGRIAIDAQPLNDGCVRLQVQDNGEGIAADQLQTVFARFGQHKARDSGLARSTGLGLNFCKLAVEAHGGNIGVDSVVGRGSTFWFTLPQADAACGQPLAASPEIASLTGVSMPALDATDRALLAPIAAALKPIPIFRYSDIRTILDRADFPSNPRIDLWRTRVASAVESENDELLAALLNL